MNLFNKSLSPEIWDNWLLNTVKNLYKREDPDINWNSIFSLKNNPNCNITIDNEDYFDVLTKIWEFVTNADYLAESEFRKLKKINFIKKINNSKIELWYLDSNFLDKYNQDKSYLIIKNPWNWKYEIYQIDEIKANLLDEKKLEIADKIEEIISNLNEENKNIIVQFLSEIWEFTEISLKRNILSYKKDREEYASSLENKELVKRELLKDYDENWSIYDNSLINELRTQILELEQIMEKYKNSIWESEEFISKFNDLQDLKAFYNDILVELYDTEKIVLDKQNVYTFRRDFEEKLFIYKNKIKKIVSSKISKISSKIKTKFNGVLN